MEKKSKRVIVKGNLKNKKIFYQFLPNELTQGSWQIRIQNLGYSINVAQPIKDICVITCNLVTSIQYSEINQIINYEEPFGMIIFDPKVKRKCINFDENWLNINVYSDELILSIQTLEGNQNLSIDCDVYFIVQLKKI
jgi:hypothetical protein